VGTENSYKNALWWKDFTSFIEQ